MQFAEAEMQVRSLATELASQRQIMEDAERKVAGLQKIILGYVEMFPELATLDINAEVKAAATDTDGRPRGAEAVRSILQDSPGEPFTVSELVGLLRARGWLPESENPANAIRTALERLVAAPDADVYKGKFGSSVAYVYDPDRERPTPGGGYGYDEESY